MTWKNLFFKMSLQDLKRRGWCMILFFIVLFFSFPVKLLLALQRLPIAELENYRAVYHYHTFGFINSKVTCLLLVGGGAVLAAMSGFSYLHFKKKVDFVHSMPIRRETLFASRFVSGLLLYFIPLILNLGFCLIISAVRGDFSTELLYSALWQLLFQFVYFLLFYGAAILAIVLIGNFVVSFLGIGVFYSYWSILWRMLHLFKSNFFQTYLPDYSEFHAYDPIGLWIQQMNALPSGKTDALLGESFRQTQYFGSGWRVLLIAFVLAVLISGAAFLLFRIRPSESTGKTMVFRISEPILKVLLIIPSGLYMGMLMRFIATSYKTAWYSFGAAFGFLLSAVILEIIFRQDFKSFFHHKISALAGGACILLITIIFQMDVFGYDYWVPNNSKVESIGFSVPFVEEYREWQEYPEEEGQASVLDSYSEGVDYEYNQVLEHCHITEPEEKERVFALVKKFARPCSRYLRKNSASSREYDIGESIEAEPDKFGNIFWIDIYIVYRMKNGKDIYRLYQMPYCEELVESIEPVYGTEAYKTAANPLLETEHNYSALLVQGDFDGFVSQIARKHQEELLSGYRKDVMKLTFYQSLFQNAEATFYLSTLSGNKRSASYKIYNSFENTLAFLEKEGYNADREPDVSNILQMTVCKDNKDGMAERKEITEPEQKKAILPFLKNMSLCAPTHGFYDKMTETAEDSYTVEVLMLREGLGDFGASIYGYEENIGCIFTEMPDFVTEMLE